MKEFLIERFKQYPIKPNTVWQGIRLRPAWMQEDNSKKLFCPHLMMWGEWPTQYIISTSEMLKHRPSHEEILNTLLQAVGQQNSPIEHRPAEIHVKDKALAEYLASKLESLGTRCVYQKNLPEIEDAALHMLSKLGVSNVDKHSEVNDDFFTITKITESQMASFFDAAKKLYRAKPWKFFDDGCLISVDYSSGDRTKLPKAFVVMGAGGIEYGLSFFESNQAYLNMLESLMYGEDALEVMSDVWGLNYGDVTEMQIPELEAWERHQWDVAVKSAFPMLLNYKTKKGVPTIHRANPKQLAYFEAVARFLADNLNVLQKNKEASGTVSTSLGEKQIAMHIEELEFE